MIYIHFEIRLPLCLKTHLRKHILASYTSYQNTPYEYFIAFLNLGSNLYFLYIQTASLQTSLYRHSNSFLFILNLENICNESYKRKQTFNIYFKSSKKNLCKHVNVDTVHYCLKYIIISRNFAVN